MIAHPFFPVRGYDNKNWLSIDGTHDCYCEVRDTQILFSFDGQIAVLKRCSFSIRHLQ